MTTLACSRCGGDRDADTGDPMQPGDTMCASCDSEQEADAGPPRATNIYAQHLAHAMEQIRFCRMEKAAPQLLWGLMRIANLPHVVPHSDDQCAACMAATAIKKEMQRDRE